MPSQLPILRSESIENRMTLIHHENRVANKVTQKGIPGLIQLMLSIENILLSV